MAEALGKIGEGVKSGTNRRYRFVPFLAGLVEDTLDLSVVEPQPIQDAMDQLRSGRMPTRGGFVETPDGLSAIDALACKVSNGLVVLLPTLKNSVGKDGRVKQDTLITLQNESGLVRIIGKSFSAHTEPFRANELGIPDYAVAADGRVVVSLDPNDCGDYEYYDTGNGELVLKRRRIIY